MSVHNFQFRLEFGLSVEDELKVISMTASSRRLVVALSFVTFRVCALVASSGFSFTAHSLNLNPDDSVGLLAVDGQGDAYQAGNVLDSSGSSWAQVTKTDPNGQVVASYRLGNRETAQTIQVDQQGSVIVAGTGYEADFLAAHSYGPATSSKVVFVVKLDPQLAGITAAAVIGGNEPLMGSAPYTTAAAALSVDAAGNIYVGGSESVTDFPVTPGAYQTIPGGGFLVEFSSGLDRIVFATYLGFGFSSMVVDNSGAIVVAYNGRTVPQTSILKLAPGGGTLLWAVAPGGLLATRSVAVDGSGDVILAGLEAGGGPQPAGTLQSCPSPDGGGFVAKLAGSSGATIFFTNFGCAVLACSVNVCTEGEASVNSAAVDASDTIWITGMADPSTLPVTSVSPAGSSYLAALAPDGSSVQALYTAGAGMFGQTLLVTPGGSPVAMGSAGFLMLANSAGGPSLLGVANSAGSAASGLIAPAELESFYGTGLGPATPLDAQITGGVVGSALGGYELLIGGVAAPLLYIGANQINAVVPNEVSGQDSVSVALVTPSGTFPLADLYIRPSEPEVFYYPVLDNGVIDNYAAAINQDGTLNSVTNPAHAGEILSVWGTGAGAPADNYSFPNGLIISGSGVQPALPVSMIAGYGLGGYGLAGSDSLEVDYAGDSPGEVFGLLQVNFRIPQPLPSAAAENGSLWVNLQVGAAISAPVLIYVTP